MLFLNYYIYLSRICLSPLYPTASALHVYPVCLLGNLSIEKT